MSLVAPQLPRARSLVGGLVVASLVSACDFDFTQFGDAKASSTGQGGGRSTSSTAGAQAQGSTVAVTASAQGSGASSGHGSSGASSGASSGSGGEVSCDEKYQDAPGYAYCSQTATFCEFGADTSDDKSCEDICSALDGTCLDAFDNDGPCDIGPADLDCSTTGYSTMKCRCSRD